MSTLASLNLSALNGTNGFRLDGINAVDFSGESVASAGDVNGDGFDDLLIGAGGGDPGGRMDAGEAYVVFGRVAGFAPSFSLSSLDGTNGFRLDGINAYDASGTYVASAGDVNGDGFGDLLIGSILANVGERGEGGEAYVVFGSDTGFEPSFALSSLNGSNGFRLGGTDGSQIGCYVASAGDVNGDGFDDLLIGAPGADPDGRENAGETYVVFGSDAGFAPSFALSSLDGTNGFRLGGISYNDFSGRSVASAGDLNGDGFDDLLIGAPNADPDGHADAGETYVVFGSDAGFAPSFALSSLDGTNGFRLGGISENDLSGRSVASAGDLNGDGFDDLLIGAPGADPDGRRSAGETYVVFGSDAGFAPSFALSSLDGTNGFRLGGIDRGDSSGSVSSAGDMNDDGFDDLVIGASHADPDGQGNAGETYVVFGAATGLSVLTIIGTENDNVLRGTPAPDLINALAGNDWIVPGTGYDTVDGGAGIDMVSYSECTTSLRIIQGDVGMRAFVGGDTDVLTNVERVTGTSQNDAFFFTDGQARGLGGQDMFHAAGDGTGTYDGGAGRDTLSYVQADAGVEASFFRGKGWGGDAAGDRYSGIEDLIGTNHADQLWGDTANNRIEGRHGDDTITGAGGDDYILAGVGTDKILYSGNRADYRIEHSGIRTEVEHLNDGVDGFDVLGHAEILRFADGDVEIADLPQLVIGTNGADRLALANGEVRGLDGDDFLNASGDGLGLYKGGAGNNMIGYQASDEGVWASLFRDRGWSGDAMGDRYSDIQNLMGSNHADQLWGDNANNRIEGLHGNDTITGAGGDDYILAGFGIDVIVYSGNRADYRIEHAGIRTEVEHLNGGNDGFDVLGHAEILRFADGDFIL